MWNEELKVPDGLYATSNIRDYFERIFRKHRQMTYNPSTKKYVN